MPPLPLRSLTLDEIRDLPPIERIPYVQRIRILYPRFNEILNRIRYAIRANQMLAEPKAILLVGPSGAGKSTILKTIVDEFPQKLTETNTIIPVFMTTVDAPATVGGLLSRLLSGIGDPNYNAGLIHARKDRLIRYIHDCQTQMVLIDEIQHFVDRDKNRVLQTVTDSLKTLIKDSHVSCVLSGIQGEAEQVIGANPQFERLFSDPIILKPFAWHEQSPETIKEFRTALTSIECNLPLEDRSYFSYRDNAWRMFVATDGIMAHIMTLIREGTMLALQSGVTSIDNDLLAEVFRVSLGESQRRVKNPFIGRPSPNYVPFEKRG